MIELADHKKINIKVVKDNKNWKFKSTEYIAALCNPKKIFKDSDLEKFSKTNICFQKSSFIDLGTDFYRFLKALKNFFLTFAALKAGLKIDGS